MKLQVNFYSETEFSVETLYDRVYQPEKEQEVDLFIFACFSLRQFRNLGYSFVSDALASTLMKSSVVSMIASNDERLTDGISLLRDAELYRRKIEKLDFRTQSTVIMEVLIDVVHNPRTTVLSRDIVANFPQLVPNRGDGEKRFIAEFPPFLFYVKGFGIFGEAVEYYAFHSTVGLIKYYSKKYADNERFIAQLEKVADSCARQYLDDKITLDQASLAMQIVKDVVSV